jgi:hypothetical protein
MNALLEHNWGASAGEDRVWAQVTGLAPDSAVRRLLMALNFQAFVDDSKTPPNGEFVLAGYIATAETWAHFSKEWEAALPFGTKTKNGKDHFKMSEMARSERTMERVRMFYNVIENYPLLPISCRVNLVEFALAQERMRILLREWRMEMDFLHWTNPYFCAFSLVGL